MKLLFTAAFLLITLIPGYISAQVQCDTVSNEVLNNYILDAEPGRDTVEYHFLSHATVRPEFPGGRCALIRYVNKNIEFPVSLADSLRPIKIYCRTIIDKNGKVKLQNRTSSQNKVLFEKARTLVENIPLFRPGQIRGENKDFEVFLIFYFTKDTTTLYSNNPYFIPVFPTNTPYYRKAIKKMCK